MPDAIWSCIFERLQGFLNSISLLFNQPTANHKSTPIEPIMTVYTNLSIIWLLCSGSGKAFLDNGNKTIYIFLRRRDLGCSRVFVVCDWGIMEGRRVISSIDAVRYIDNVTYLGILTNEMERGMGLVCLTQSLLSTSNKLEIYFHCSKTRCPNEIWHALNSHPLQSGYEPWRIPSVHFSNSTSRQRCNLIAMHGRDVGRVRLGNH